MHTIIDISIEMILPGILTGSGLTVSDFIWAGSVAGPQSFHENAVKRGF